MDEKNTLLSDHEFDDWNFEDDDESICDVLDAYNEMDWDDMNDDSDILDEFDF